MICRIKILASAPARTALRVRRHFVQQHGLASVPRISLDDGSIKSQTRDVTCSDNGFLQQVDPTVSVCTAEFRKKLHDWDVSRKRGECMLPLRHNRLFETLENYIRHTDFLTAPKSRSVRDRFLRDSDTRRCGTAVLNCNSGLVQAIGVL